VTQRCRVAVLQLTTQRTIGQHHVRRALVGQPDVKGFQEFAKGPRLDAKSRNDDRALRQPPHGRARSDLLG
jgi:hypothetical protein